MTTNPVDQTMTLEAKYLGEKGGCWNMLVFINKNKTKQVLIPKQSEYSGVDFSQVPFGERVDIKVTTSFVNRNGLVG